MKGGSDVLRRQSRGLQPRSRLLIVTEGKVTEPAYLKQLKHSFRNPLVAIEIVPGQQDPLSLVKRATELARAAANEARSKGDPFANFDEAWVVCDVDQHPTLAAAQAAALRNGVQIALSDPCFELWFVLHRELQLNQIDRAKLQSKARKLFAYKDKAWPFERHHSDDTYAQAVAHAKQLLKRAKTTGQRNPSTTVHELTEKMRKP